MLKKEFPYFLIIAMPLIYLAYIWNDLPRKVPMHWNINGEIDRYGSKTGLLWLILLMPVSMYLILSVVPKIDPKGQIKKMGNKYDQIKFFLVTFMSLLSLFIIYMAKTKTLTGLNYIFVMIGMLYLILGKFFKTIEPNYFIGIRTPWTLENETVWKKTHQLAGKLWIAGGILVVIFSLILDKLTNLYVFIAITLVIILIPLIYSYKKFQHLKTPE